MTVERVQPVDIKEKLEQSSVGSLYVYPIKSCGGSSLEVAEIVDTGIKHDRELMLVFPNGKFISQRDKGCEKLAVVHPEFIEDNLVRITAHDMPELYVPIIREGVPFDAVIHKTQGIQVIDQGEDSKKWFGEYLKTGDRKFDCKLVSMEKHYKRQVSQRWAPRESNVVGFADGYNLLLVSQESLDDLNTKMPKPLPISRFRPNIVLAGSGVPYGEDQMRKIRIGEVVFDVVKPCIRCNITMVDQSQGKRIPDEMRKEPLAALSKYRMIELKTGDKGPTFGENLVHQNTGTIKKGDEVKVLQTQPPPRLYGLAK